MTLVRDSFRGLTSRHVSRATGSELLKHAVSVDSGPDFLTFDMYAPANPIWLTLKVKAGIRPLSRQPVNLEI